jgi:tRNA(Arg) A34 adenosine deaminase TadA
MQEINLMERAIREAEKFKTPFGAVLFNGYQIIAAANSSRVDGKLHHAEMNVFLKKPADFKKDKPLELFTTCEPCPMCTGAAIWEQVDYIYYGVSIEEASKFLPQIMISSREIVNHSFHKPEIKAHRMNTECLALFESYT